ncbi:hypothetical protein NKI45_05075 [Mesorhizobium sp. M0619]|uniref:hypothetical protein n=1 Tax=Mesorhizobium sp. M0619 TaxID=2956973 RepID=UPI00333B434D
MFASVLKGFGQRFNLDFGLLQGAEETGTEPLGLRGGSLQVLERLAASGAELFKLALEFLAAVEGDALFDC